LVLALEWAEEGQEVALAVILIGGGNHALYLLAARHDNVHLHNREIPHNSLRS